MSARFAESLRDLESWFETIGKTAQVTFRTKMKPPYLVRILKHTERHLSLDKMYVQAVGWTLEEALERCVEAYMTDGWIQEELTGHRGAPYHEPEDRAEGGELIDGDIDY